MASSCFCGGGSFADGFAGGEKFSLRQFTRWLFRHFSLVKTIDSVFYDFNLCAWSSQYERLGGTLESMRWAKSVEIPQPSYRQTPAISRFKTTTIPTKHSLYRGPTQPVSRLNIFTHDRRKGSCEKVVGRELRRKALG